MRSIFFVVFLLIVSKSNGFKKVANIEGDVNIAVLLTNCHNSSELIPFKIQSMISSTLWTVQRINYLELLSPIKLGVEIYEICNETDYFETIFELYQRDEEVFLGLISGERLSDKVIKFCDVLDIKAILTSKYDSFRIKAAIKFLSALGWIENVTVYAPHEHIIDEFFIYSKEEYICIKECMVYG